MTLILAAILGVVIGISLGALGGGGSILTVPALVYALGQSPHSATTASLVIVGITAAAGAAAHARAGRVKWSAGTGFGVAGIAASYAGTALNRRMDPNALLLAFAALMLVTAVAMLLRSRPRDSKAVEIPTQPLPETVPMTRHRLPYGDAAAALPPASGDSVRPATVSPKRATAFGPALLGKVVLAGVAVGFLTGFLGVGGGFIIVPALVMVLGYPMPVAVGTSLLVIAINSAAALAARVGHQTFHWSVIVPFTLAAIVGSLAGRRASERMRPDTLARAFSGLLIAIAIYVTVRSLSAL